MKNFNFYLISLCLLLGIMLINTNAFCQTGGVSISPNGGAPDASAALDVSNYNNKGFLMPRLTGAQRDAISSPAAGLVIYNTDCNVIDYNAGTPGSPNWLPINALAAGVSIAASPMGGICMGNSVIFTATPSNGINPTNYQWQLNGSNVGTNSSTYTNAGFNNGDVVNCILTTSQTCVTGSPVTSNSITMTLNPVPLATGPISGPDTVCPSSNGNVYTTNSVFGATTYTWAVPSGASITGGEGTTSATIFFGDNFGGFGINSGNVSVTAANACGTSSTSTFPVTIRSIPATPGTISGPNSVCSNATGNVYSISAVSGANSYNWTVPSGASITANSGTSVTVTFGANPVGNVAVSATNNCGTGGQSTLSISQSSICSPITFSYTGVVQTFTVPAGITSVTISAYGAQGGSTTPDGNGGGDNIGGLGGYDTGTLSVTAGQTLYIFVGGQGAVATDNRTFEGGGFNGGGNGYGCTCNYGFGSGGGGASDVRVGGTALSNREIVAGGGGGVGPSAYGLMTGGTGGGTTGGDCMGGNGSSFNGKGGTQNSGGAGGNGSPGGSLGQGGQAGTNNEGGGGGGGGYYGGGGGDAGGGGGGSGYIGGVTNGYMYNGVQSGNGQVIISW